MEPLDDRELEDDQRILQQWQAPGAPPSLRAKVLPPSHWWQWLTTGNDSRPVPVGIALLLAVAALLYFPDILTDDSSSQRSLNRPSPFHSPIFNP